MARDKAALLQRRHMPKQGSTAHLTFIRQTLGAWVALACFFVLEVRQLNEDNLGGGLQAFDIRGPDQRHTAHAVASRTGRAVPKAFETFPLSSRFFRGYFKT